MPLSTNRSRPNLPYVPTQTLPNSNRYQALNKFPPKAEQLDADLNALVDMVNEVAQGVNETAAGIFPGAGNMLNAHKLATTDGQGNVSWTDVNSNNIAVAAVQERHIQSQAVTTDKIQQRAVKGLQIGLGEVSAENLASDAVTGSNIKKDSIPLNKLTAPSSDCLIAGVGGPDAHYYNCILPIPWTVPSVAVSGGGVTSQYLHTVFNNSEANFDGGKLKDNSIDFAKLVREVREALVPTGTIMAYSGTSLRRDYEQPGFLSCDGRSLLISDYPKLYSIIGKAYNYTSSLPDNVFCLPDLRGRTIFGICSDSSGQGTVGSRITAQTMDTIFIGRGGGFEQVALTVDQIPPHQHTYNESIIGHFSPGSGIGIVSSQLNATGSVGSGAAHNNMPPFILLNWLIKT